MPFQTNTAPATAYSLAIGSAIGGNVSGGILFGNSANNLAQNSTKLFWDQTNELLGLGIASSLLARLHAKGKGATSATSSAIFTNSANTPALTVNDDLTSTFGGSITTTKLISPLIDNGGGGIIATLGNGTLEVQTTNPNQANGAIKTTGAYSRTDNSIKSIIEVNNAVTSTIASFTQLNGFGFTSSLTQTVGKIVGLYIAPTIVSVTDFTAIEVITGKSIFGGVVRLKGYTVATLPAGTVGDTAYVTDALLPAFLVAIAGGGAVTTKVFYDGANWVAG